LETEVKRLHDEVATLTAAIEAAIEEAIKNGQKSVASRDRISRCDQVSNKNSARTPMNASPRIIGWVDDF